MADDISVQISADAQNLADELNTTADKVGESMDQFQQSVENAGDSLDKSLGEGADNAKEKLEGLGETTNNIGEMFSEMKGKLDTAFEAGGILLAADAIEKVAGYLEEAMERATQFNNQAEVLGVTVEQYQSLAEAAKEAGVGTGILIRSAVRLKVQLDEAHQGVTTAIDKLKLLGITSEDIADSTFGENEALSVLGDRLRNASTEAETMSAIQKEFGARAALVAEALKGFHGSAEDIATDMQRLNGLTHEQVEQLHEMHKFWSQVGTWISDATAKALLFGSAALKAGGEAESVLAGGGGGEEGEGGAGGAQAKSAEAAKESAREVSAAYDQLAKQQLDDQKALVAETKAGTLERLNAEDAYVGMVEGYYGEKSAAYKKAIAEEAKAQQEFNDKEAKDAADTAAGELRYAEKMYADHVSILKKAQAEMMKGWDEYFKEYEKRDDAMVKGAEQAAVAQIQSSQKILNAQQSAKIISPEEWATQYIETIKKIEDATVAMYEKLKAGADGNVAVMEQMNNNIAKAHEKATQEIIATELKATQEVRKNWEAVTKPIETSFTSALDGMLKGTDNFHTATKKMFDTLAIDVINGAVHRMLTSWLSAEAAKIAASETGSKVLSALGLENLVVAKTTDATAAVSDITTKAAQAAAGAFAATAAIPYVGPMLAPAAAAEADASVMAFIGQIASAAGGMMVDKDQMAMVHEDEMILPSHISQGIQEHILNPEAESGGGGGGSNNHFHINAHDSKSFEKYLGSQRNRNAMMSSLQKAHMRGNRAARF